MADVQWHECPFDDADEAELFLDSMRHYDCEIIRQPDMVRTGEGSEPELDAARSTAIAPDATLEQLQDKAWLEARLPGVLAEFKTTMEGLGFTY